MRHRIRRIRWPARAAAGELVVGSGTAYAVTSDEPTGSYRTAKASKGDVEQLLSTSGTVDAANRADHGVGTAGTVAGGEVALGERVRAGQVIATLDRKELRAAVKRARASLARAVAQLEADEDAQAEDVADASSSDQDQPQADKPQADEPQADEPQADDTTPADTGKDPATEAALAKLKEQQDAVTEAQSAATAAIAAAKDALAAQQQACENAYEEPPAAAAGDDACSEALEEVQARQDDVSAAQDTLADALSALVSTLSEAIATLDTSSDSDTPSDSSTPSGSDDSSDDTQSPAADDDTTPAADDSNPQSATSSAAALAADQAEIENARADLVDARQELGQAVLRSTRSGVIRSLDVRKGDEISAGDVVAVVVGGRAVTRETAIPESKIGQVKVGQRVRVSMPGESDTAEGTVTAIGLVADSSSGTASYPVTVTVEDPAIALPAGAEALLAIVVATAEDVLTVPLSAVTRRGDGATIRTWDGKKLSREEVTIGTVGAREVEVTDGLSVGDEVVLADMDEDITGASDSINDRGSFEKGPAIRIGGPGGSGGPATFKSGK
jgi:multidrug efflux pump subunit AcrA (membrane-fusion protein)